MHCRHSRYYRDVAPADRLSMIRVANCHRSRTADRFRMSALTAGTCRAVAAGPVQVSSKALPFVDSVAATIGC